RWSGWRNSIRSTRCCGPAPASSRYGPAARAAGCSTAPRCVIWSMTCPTASWPWSAPMGTSCTIWTGAPTSPWPCSKTWRLTAPNPGYMTGPGTNSYLVGDPATGYLVIDPGPDEPEHIERLWRAAGGDIRIIVCTHSHPDHSPGARPLQALCSVKPAILGLPSAATARPHSEFSPDRVLDDGELVVLEGGGVRHSLKAIHTPGHAANHLCLVLLEDGLLFSGDHVLNGSTT